MAGSGKDKLEYVKQQKPKFLREFMSRANFKEGPTIETKKQQGQQIIEEREERDDEKPVICALKEGDLTEQDYEKYLADREEEHVDPENDGNKITFKKPAKRKSEERVKSAASLSKKVKKDKEKTTKKAEKVDNKSLLSFDNDEED